MGHFLFPVCDTVKVKQPAGKTLFQETQSFRQSWVWIVVLGSLALPLIILLILYFTVDDPKAREVGGALLVVSVTATINILAFYMLKLETMVTDEGVYYRWWPYRSKYSYLPWSSIQEVIVKRYPHYQYGFHYSRKFGTVHNIKGDRGVQFILTNKAKVYLGTQRIAALQHTLESMRAVAVEVKHS